MSGKNENSEGAFGLIVICFIILMIVLTNNFHWIVNIWKNIRTTELTALSYLNIIPNVDAGLSFLSRVDPKAVSADEMTKFDLVFAKYLVWIPGLFFLVMGAKTFARDDLKNEKFNMESLLSNLSKYFIFNQSYVERNPNNQPIEYDPYDPETAEEGSSVWPEEYLVACPPYYLEEVSKADPTLNRPIYSEEEGFDEELARLSFSFQLGNKFTGVSGFNETEMVVYNNVVNRVHYDTVFIKNCLKRIVLKFKKKTARDGKKIILTDWEIDILKSVEPILEKNEETMRVGDRIINKLVQNKSLEKVFDRAWSKKIMAGHGFSKTALLALIDHANFSDGAGGHVISSPGGLPKIIKKNDRALWYALMSAGRNVSFPESAGVFSHWTMEKHLGYALLYPEVTEAIEGLKKATIDKEA